MKLTKNDNKLRATCFLCGWDKNLALFSYNKPDKYEQAVGVSDRNYFRKWVQCLNCGFCYSLYSRNNHLLDKIYLSTYRNNACGWYSEPVEARFKRIIALPKVQSENKIRIAWIRRNIKSAWQHNIVFQGKPPYNFLDIGGGIGVFAWEFKNKDWLAHIVDPNKDSIFVKKKLNIPLRLDYYQPKQFKKSFSLITLIYVLEHLRKPAQLLNQLGQDLSRDGFLYIEVPDAIAFKYRPSSDDIFNSCHLWMFSPQALVMMLSSCGLEIFSLQRILTKKNNYAIMVLAGKKDKYAKSK